MLGQEARKNVLKRSQSIIITGESGAGKTETTNYLVKFLTDTAEPNLMEVLNDAGTVLNAFGNAKTDKNENSSRYFKFIEVFVFHSDIHIIYT